MRRVIVSVVLGLVYSFCYAVMGPMTLEQRMEMDPSMVFPFLICFFLTASFTFLLLSFRQKWTLDEKKGKVSGWLDKIGDRRLLLITWAFLFLAWIPAYLILYPGVLSYDIISQTTSALTEITNNHHPILHTWLIRVFMNFGNSFFSGYEAGLGFLSLLQMILLSYALARLVLTLKRQGLSSVLLTVITILSAIWFETAVMAVTIVKDTGHVAFLILFVCHYLEIVIDPARYREHRANYVLLPLISFFMFALRNNGLHIYLFCFLGLMILRIRSIRNIKQYIRLLIVILLPVILFKIYTGPVFHALNIEQGEIREAFSVPIQQLQRVAVLHWDELDPEDQETMNYYIDDLSWRSWDPGRKYDPFNADPAKSCFFSDHYKEDPPAFWKYWGKLGARFSKEYLVAFLTNSLGYWYPGYYNYSYVMYENYTPDVFQVPLERKSVWSPKLLSSLYESFCMGEIWRKIPVVRAFFVPAYGVWIVLYALILSWKKKGFFTGSLPIFLPLLAELAVMFMCPIASFRYSWPLFVLLPIALIGIRDGRKE